MRKLLLALGMVLALASPAMGQEGPKDKVTICHMPGTPAEQTMEVPPEAVPGHIGHGDYLGPCVPASPSPEPTEEPTPEETSPAPDASPPPNGPPGPSGTQPGSSGEGGSVGEDAPVDDESDNSGSPGRRTQGDQQGQPSLRLARTGIGLDLLAVLGALLLLGAVVYIMGNRRGR